MDHYSNIEDIPMFLEIQAERKMVKKSTKIIPRSRISITRISNTSDSRFLESNLGWVPHIEVPAFET
jgi:hypothetical protein